MTIEQAEAELIRVLDAKVAAGYRLRIGNGDGVERGCALQAVLKSGFQDLVVAARDLFEWDHGMTWAFISGFDGFGSTAAIADPDHAALGDRIARRYGVR